MNYTKFQKPLSGNGQLKATLLASLSHRIAAGGAEPFSSEGGEGGLGHPLIWKFDHILPLQ